MKSSLDSRFFDLRFFDFRWCAAALCAAGFLAAASSGQAQVKAAKNHDGVYGVDIFTQEGSCDRSYHWTIQVADGRVSGTDVMVQASGRIDPNGAVSLAFRRYNNVAHVAGSVNGNSGSGTWSSPTMQCGGSWRAARQS